MTEDFAEYNIGEDSPKFYLNNTLLRTAISKMELLQDSLDKSDKYGIDSQSDEVFRHLSAVLLLVSSISEELLQRYDKKYINDVVKPYINDLVSKLSDAGYELPDGVSEALK